MAQSDQLICRAAALVESGKGVRFELDLHGSRVPGFVVRYAGTVHAYLNQCAHLGVELDWLAGEFFDESGLYLICATHGAIFAPESGYCRAGPCKGGSLRKLQVIERDGGVFLIEGAELKGTLRHGGADQLV